MPRRPELSGLFRRLSISPGTVPRRLEHRDLVAEALTREHLDDDLRAVNDSVELIRRTRGGEWPAGPVTREFDFDDLVWHEVEFRNGDSFAYAIRETGGTYVGCAYLYPIGRRAMLTEALLEHDVDVSWWVTPAAYEDGRYAGVHEALRHWLANELPFDAPHFSNLEIPPE